MKNATKHQRKIKKFLAGIRKSATHPLADQDPFRVMIDAMLAADAPKQSAKAIEALEKEYVDFNELRVSPIREIADTLGRDFIEARRKAGEITTVLNSIFKSRNSLTLDYVEKMPKRDLRRHLHELGLSPFASAVMMMRVFGGHAIPVDQGLVDCLEIDGYVEPGSSIEDVQAFLERIILQKQAPAAHEFFREYVMKNAKMLAKKRRAAAAKAKARADAEAKKEEEEAQAKAAAEAKKAEAKARAAAKAKKAKARPAAKGKKAKSKAAAKAKKASAKHAAKPPAKAGKRSPRKRATAKTPTKGAAKSARPAPARKKAAPKATRKATRKPASKARGKAASKASRKTKDK